MSDAPKQYIQFLDQLIPLLEAAPTWFKIWIYGLIFLNFATIAATGIFYLSSRDQQAKRQSLAAFTIERPQNQDQLPLDLSRSWMLEGQFPVLARDDKSGVPEVTLEVFKLPERQEVRQSGKFRISTVEGHWRFESATFADNGEHEIVAALSLGHLKLFRSVRVFCLSKSDAYRNAIAADRQSRHAPPLAPAEASTISLAEVQRELDRKQTEFWTQYPRNLEPALTTVLSALDILDRSLPAFADDPYLQNHRAYMLKNYAMIMRDQRRPDEFERALNESARMFAALRQQNLSDASAWNGLGSIEVLRGNPEKALIYINQALELVPDYEAAQKDRATAEAMIRSQSRQKK